MEVGHMTTAIVLKRGPHYHITNEGELVIELPTDEDLMQVMSQELDELKRALLRRFGEAGARRVTEALVETLHETVAREVILELIRR